MELDRNGRVSEHTTRHPSVVHCVLCTHSSCDARIARPRTDQEHLILLLLLLLLLQLDFSNRFSLHPICWVAQTAGEREEQNDEREREKKIEGKI